MTEPGHWNMDQRAQSSRKDAVDQILAAESLGYGSSADRHAEGAAQSFKLSDGGVLQYGKNKSSQELEVVPDDVLESPGYHGFFSPGFASLRHQYLTIVTRATILIIGVMWITLPVYWGALSNSANLTVNLEAWFIDRDGSRVGNALTQAVKEYSPPGPQLNWKVLSPADVGSDDDVANMVLKEQVWIAVVIQPNASTSLSRARVNGDKTYDPTSAIKVYYSQARQEVATGNYIIPLTTQMLQTTTSAYATSTAQRYFAQINSNGQPNATALQLIANAPQTITPAISWTMVNLRPYNDPAAQALTLVGNIFICIFSFMITMAHSTARAIVSPHMDLLPYIWLRICVPLVAYFPLSMSYSLINLAFRLPLGTKFGQGAGFMLTFVYIYLGTAALGLSLEAMITIFTPRFVPFFLFVLILYNVSPVVLPDELQSPIYAYGNGFPIWNLSQALRTILFNTNSHLGRNAAVIFAWILLSCGTLSLLTWYTRRHSARHSRPPTPVTSPEKSSSSKVDKGKDKEDKVMD